MLLMKSSIPSSYLISFTQTPFKIALWFSFKIVFSRMNTVLETGTGMQAWFQICAVKFLLATMSYDKALWQHLKRVFQQHMQDKMTPG